MKALFSSKHRTLLIRRAVNVCALSILAVGLLSTPATGAPANSLIAGSTVTLTLMPHSGNCDVNKPIPACLADSLDLKYLLKHNPTGVKLVKIGVFQDSCKGSSMMVGTTAPIADGSASGDITESVLLPKNIPNNWVFCWFLSEAGTSQLFALGNFTPGPHGLTANASLMLASPPLFSGSTVSLTLLIPPSSGCDVNQPYCVVDVLDLHYNIQNSLPGIKLAMVGVFQDSCQGSSMMVVTTDRIEDGQDTKDFRQNVILQQIPQNWIFCLFMADGGSSQLRGQGKFTIRSASNGLIADANLQSAS